MYENLKIEMTRQDISQRELAALLNVHENTIKNKLDGKSSFTIEEAFKIKMAKFPQCELKYLFKNNNSHEKKGVTHNENQRKTARAE